VRRVQVELSEHNSVLLEQVISDEDCELTAEEAVDIAVGVFLDSVLYAQRQGIPIIDYAHHMMRWSGRTMRRG
jgi:hypothetical protein